MTDNLFKIPPVVNWPQITGKPRDDMRVLIRVLDGIYQDIVNAANLVVPAFSAIPAESQDTFAKDEWVDVVFGTEEYDLRGDFASNTFTAPIAGKYLFSFSVAMTNLDSAATYYAARILATQYNYQTIFDVNELNSDVENWSLHFSQLVDMAIGDTAKVQIYQSNGAVQTNITTDSFFSGFLAVKE